MLGQLDNLNSWIAWIMSGLALDTNPLTGLARIWHAHDAVFDGTKFTVLVDLGLRIDSPHFNRLKHSLIFRNYADFRDETLLRDADSMLNESMVYLGKTTSNQYSEWWFCCDDAIADTIEDPSCLLKQPADEVFLPRNSYGSSFRDILLPTQFVPEAESTIALCQLIKAEQIDLSREYCIRHWVLLDDLDTVNRFTLFADESGYRLETSESNGSSVRVRLTEWGHLSMDARYHSSARLFVISQRFGGKLEGWEADLSRTGRST